MSNRAREAAKEASDRIDEQQRRAEALEAGTDPDEHLGPAELAAKVRRR